ncbi:MAG: prepilin-type N-terminal cleavage/methylation domain-containing protein [Candidatus Riflebacteria bacterium]|nr:prepilin-type N-terminal cleavage/methylation domain-containing protein [Candidatus Riflebacteria bacterium]
MKKFNNKPLKSGFSLIEALIGILIIGVVGISVFMLISTSNRTNLADYYRMTGESIAKEAIEVFQCLGYEEISGRKNTTLAGYALDVWQPVEVSIKDGIKRSENSSAFLRKIVLEPVENDGIMGVLVEVEVKSKGFFSGLGKIEAKTMVIKK